MSSDQKLRLVYLITGIFALLLQNQPGKQPIQLPKFPRNNEDLREMIIGKDSSLWHCMPIEEVTIFGEHHVLISIDSLHQRSSKVQFRTSMYDNRSSMSHRLSCMYDVTPKVWHHTFIYVRRLSMSENFSRTMYDRAKSENSRPLMSVITHHNLALSLCPTLMSQSHTPTNIHLWQYSNGLTSPPPSQGKEKVQLGSLSLEVVIWRKFWKPEIICWQNDKVLKVRVGPLAKNQSS